MIVDLFCGRGGVACGLIRAGVPPHEIVGIDIDRRRGRHYPGRFIHADATRPPVDLAAADLVWASPPCQAYIRTLSAAQRGRHPDLVARVRDLLTASGVQWWAMENVAGAPMRADIVLTGPMIGLPRIERRRLFEVSWRAATLTPPPAPAPPFSSGRRVTITRSLSSSCHFYPRRRIGLRGAVTRAEALEAMGLDPVEHQTWTRQEIANAVAPPMVVEVIRQARAAGWNCHDGEAT